MDKRKQNSGPYSTGAIPKRNSSLGLRNRSTVGAAGGGDYDIPSTSRQVTMQRSNSGLKSSDLSSGTRISRLSSRDSHVNRRSRSQEPSTSKRQLLIPTPDTHEHMNNVGVLLTPVRLTPSHSPDAFSLASSSRASSVRRSALIPQKTGPPSKMKDGRSINDKLFQANCIGKIQTFLRSKDIQSIRLKPMSITALITTYNAIIETVDPTWVVTSRNYIESIPKLLGVFEYPTVLPKSTFAAVGSGHATQQLIAMLSWLLDSCEVTSKFNAHDHLFKAAENNEEDKKVKTTVQTLFEGFRLFQLKAEEPDVEDFLDIHCGITGDPREEMRSLQAEIDELESKLNKCLADPEKKESEEKIQQLDLKESLVSEKGNENRALSETIKNRKLTRSTNRDSIAQLDVDLSCLDDQIAEMQDEIRRQPMTAAERDEVKRKCEAARQEGQIKTNYLGMLETLTDKIDIKLTTTRNKIGNVTQYINCLILESGIDQSLKWTDTPNFNVLDKDALENISQHWDAYEKQLVQEGKETVSDTKTEKENMLKLQQDYQRIENELKAKTEEMCLHDAETKKIQMEYTKSITALELEIKSTKDSCFKLKDQLDAKPKLQDIEAIIKCVMDEKRAVKENLEKFKLYVETRLIPDLEKLKNEHLEEVVKPEIQKIRDDILGKE